MKKSSIYFFLLAGLIFIIGSCKKDEPLPKNPYDDVDYGKDTTTVFPPDPNSITGLFQNIFRVKCNNPGCHDGTFEPDFRSVQSAWRTLVYHPVVKNDSGFTYNYRVVPNNVSKSMLHHRLTTGDGALQQMPATGQYLTSAEVQNVENWINAGAPDMLGNIPVFPNLEPSFLGYIATDAAYTRIDTSRVGGIYYNAFNANPNSVVNFILLVSDDSTLVNGMQYNKLKFSYDRDNYSASLDYTASYVNLFGTEIWLATVNTSAFGSDTTVFFRYYFNDGDHVNNTEFPRTDMADPYKTYCSMYIKP